MRASRVGEVWENLILIQAADAERAYQKAYSLGQQAEGDSNGTLRLDGAPASVKFLGISDLGLVHDGIVDGTEILFRKTRSSILKARSKIRRRRNVVAMATKELAPYKTLSERREK